MKRSAFACLVAAFSVATAHAGPAESAIVAAMKLPDAPNYSWITAVDDDARSYEIVGKTDKATDLSLVTMPMIGAINRRMYSRGSAGTDNQATVAFKGDEKFVVQIDEAWKTPEELSPGGSSRYGSRGGYGGYGGGGYGGMRGRGRRGGSNPFPSENSDGSSGPAYSNLQRTLSRPHEEIALIVAGYTDLRQDEGGVFSGTLSEDAAKLLLVHAGQDTITPLRASGTFRLWIKDGVLQKYETKLDGTLSIEMRSDKHEVNVHQKSVTTVKDVGVTKVDVPADAKKKLGA